MDHDTTRVIALPTQPWQLRKGRNTSEKLAVVTAALTDVPGVTSVLDIGCNAGVLTRGLGGAGFFTVGIDTEVNVRGVDNPLENACLGQVAFDHDLVRKIPKFDAALVLSVHHHFVRTLGDTEAMALIGALAHKIEHVMIFEVSSKSTEYGAQPDELFTDGSEASVTAYTRDWLHQAIPGWETTFIWMNKRRPRLSNRFMFACHRHAASL